MWSLTNTVLFVLTALFITAIWVKASGIYRYRGKNHYFLGLNIFPLIFWTIGLMVTRFFYDVLNHPYKFIIVCLGYWLVLLSLEFVGYHYFGVRLASNYPGLWNLDLMHAPAYSKAYYLLIGPAYLLFTNGLILELAKMGLVMGI
jgi:hypothetical protein